MRVQGVLFFLASLAWLLIAPLALFMAAMSPMISDAGLNRGVWTLMMVFVTFPIACLLGPIAGWIAWKKGRRRLAWGIIASPLLWIVAVVVVSMTMMQP